MNSWMRKGLAALVAAGFLLVGGGQVHAVIGIPDDVPANTLLYPFFKVNPSRTGSAAQDTIIVATNTDSVAHLVHFIIWSQASQHVYDFNVLLTGNDVFSCSLYDLIEAELVKPGTGGCANDSERILPAPSAVAARLLNSDTKLLQGYVTADVVSKRTSLLPIQQNYPRDPENVLIGHEYIVDLPAGSATGVNAASVEVASNNVLPALGTPSGHPALALPGACTGFFFTTRNAAGACVASPLSTSGGDGLERLNGREAKIAQLAGAAQPNPDLLTAWDEIVRYFTVRKPGAIEVTTELWVWKDTNNPGLLVNIAVYDEAEHVHSVSLDLPFEVNFRKVNDIITPGAPGGWFRIPLSSELQSVAYSLQLANDSTATLRWDAIFPAHRQYTDFFGGTGPTQSKSAQ